jgi:hypothetical protein
MLLRKVGLEVNAEEIKYTFMSHHQIAGQSHYIGYTINPLKMWHSSNVWEIGWVEVMPAAVQFRIFCLTICCLKP